MKKLLLPLLVFALSALVLSGCSFFGSSSAPSYPSVVSTGQSVLKNQIGSSARMRLSADFTLKGQRLASNDLAPLVERQVDVSMQGIISDQGSLLDLRAKLGSAESRAIFYSGITNAVRVDGNWYRQRDPFFYRPLSDEALLTKTSWGEIFSSLGRVPALESREEEINGRKMWVYTLAGKGTPDLGSSRVASIIEEAVAAGSKIEVGYLVPTAQPTLIRIQASLAAGPLAKLIGFRGAKDLPGVEGMEGQIELQVSGWGSPLPLPPDNLLEESEGNRILGWEFLPLWTEGLR